MKRLIPITWTMARRFFVMTAGSVLTLALASVALIWFVGGTESDKSGQRLRQVLRDAGDENLRQHVQVLHHELTTLVKLRDQGILDDKTARELARGILRDARYGDSGYFWADTFDGVNIVLLGKGEEGLGRWNARDSTGKLYIQELHRAGREVGGGFVEYLFPRPGSLRPEAKRGYALAFEPFAWVIGSGYYLEDIEAQVQKRVESTKKTVEAIQWSYLTLLVVILLVLIGLSAFIGHRISRPLDDLRLRFEQLALDEPSMGVQLEVRSQDDIAALIRAFNLFMNRYNRVFQHRHAYQVLTEKLAILAEAHDGETSAHTIRVGALSGLLARHMDLPEDVSQAIAHAARLHDVGKLFLDPRLINKLGKISDHERDLLKSHTLLAEKLLEGEHFELERTIALYHHERIDGSGYPYGLQGDDIPLVAQIVGVADVYDALHSTRSYKAAHAPEEALAIMRHGDTRMKAGGFNPRILDVLEARLAEIEAVVYRN